MSVSRPSAGAGIGISGLTKHYGATPVMADLSLQFAPGAFTVVLGPSGCGKSTLLRIIAGLEAVDAGTVTIGGRAVEKLPPKARGVAMVFQNYALYPHMSVAQNIGYGLKLSGMPRMEREERIATVARTLGLEALLARKPFQLSGGQRQRVAIGRAIAREPQVLLFDEPLSNLDAQLRTEMRLEIAELHRRTGATSIFVTHDQTEAMTLADQIVVMNQGRVEQIGTPDEIYQRPATAFVARFIGSPPMNLIEGAVVDGTLRCADVVLGRTLAPAGRVQIGIRPERVQLGRGPFSARVGGVERLGREVIYHLKAPWGTLSAVSADLASPRAAGDTIAFGLDPQSLLLFGSNDRRLEVAAIAAEPLLTTV